MTNLGVAMFERRERVGNTPDVAQAASAGVRLGLVDR